MTGWDAADKLDILTPRPIPLAPPYLKDCECRNDLGKRGTAGGQPPVIAVCRPGRGHRLGRGLLEHALLNRPRANNSNRCRCDRTRNPTSRDSNPYADSATGQSAAHRDTNRDRPSAFDSDGYRAGHTDAPANSKNHPSTNRDGDTHADSGSSRYAHSGP